MKSFVHRKHPLYCTWKSMRTRCNNPNVHNYPRYGGRGIRVCKRWDSFELFLKDVGPKPTPQHTLDRWPNKNGNYTPANTRWATKEKQANNCNSNLVIEYQGKSQTLAEWCRELGLRYSRAQSRLNKGYPIEIAFVNAPIRVNRKKRTYRKVEKDTTKRDNLIKANLEGKTFKEIGQIVGLTASRVGNLVKHKFGIEKTPIPQKFGENHPRAKTFMGCNLITGEKKTFYSLQEASRYIGTFTSIISKILHSDVSAKTTKKWTFKYIN